MSILSTPCDTLLQVSGFRLYTGLKVEFKVIGLASFVGSVLMPGNARGYLQVRGKSANPPIACSVLVTRVV
jgi:hypothetical protein